MVVRQLRADCQISIVQSGKLKLTDLIGRFMILVKICTPFCKYQIQISIKCSGLCTRQAYTMIPLQYTNIHKNSTYSCTYICIGCEYFKLYRFFKIFIFKG